MRRSSQGDTICVLGATPKDEDGWYEEMGFNENNEIVDSIDRFLVSP